MDRVILGLAAAAALALDAQTLAADLPLPKDGWASWQVEASERAPAFCCGDSWDASVGKTRACDLDEGRRGFGTRHNEKTDAIRIYARFIDGKLDRLHTLAAACPVKTGTPVDRLEGIRTDDSVRWLTRVARRDDLEHEVPASLAVHQGALALDSLKKLARTDASTETRQHAIFWLAQRGSADAEAVISAAMRGDPDGGVREHALFALSQLPDDRATTALIAAAEDRSLAREQRKRALFWLAQSEAEGARQYLDRVLLGASR
jgi:hypothetical protein